jgi:lysophospholipase L1-like esterase
VNRRTRLKPTYAPVGDGPFSGVATHLRHDRCALIQGYGDSTMSGPGRAFDLMAVDMGTYFDANMWYMPFDDTNKTYFNPTPYRTSSRGIRGVGGAGGKIAGIYQGTLPVGDITIEMLITMPSWTPASSSELLTKWDEAAAGAGHTDQKGIHFGIGTTGLLYFGWTTDGATTTTAVSTASVPFTAGNPGWIKAVFQANDGSGNNTVKFYTSSSGFSYAQLGSTVTTAGTVTSVYQSSTPYQLLSRNKEFATNHAPVGTYVHFLRVRDAAGNDYVPVLPDKWDPNTTTTLEPVYNSGAPILLAASGAISGWSLTNLTDPVRYSQLNSLKGSDLIIIEDGHNENSLTQRQFIDQYISYVRRLKRAKGHVPIVVTTQNPYDKAGTNWTSNPATADFNPTKMAWLARAMAGEPGVWPIDTFQAFWDPTAGTMLNADGRHPSATGYQAKADFVRKFLLPKAFI